MPLTRSTARAERRKPEMQEKVLLAKNKMHSALVQIDEMAERYKEEVDTRLKLIRDSTDPLLLQMKWSDLVDLKIDHFADYRGPAASGPTTRSRSVSQRRGRIRTKQQTWTRVQSVDREQGDEDEGLTFGFLRWPRAGELVLSKAGSPLAVHQPLERCANVNIPTAKGVITVKPHKMTKVKREVLMTLDENTLEQVKTLTSNLGKIVDLATKMEKL